MQQDTPLKRRSINEMTTDEVNALVASTRERRLKPIHDYESALEARKQYKDEKARELLDRKCELFDNQLRRVDNAIAKLEKYALDVAALRLQLE